MNTVPVRPKQCTRSYSETRCAPLGLDDSYGACVGRLPGVTLAGVNLMSFFGLHRRWRGAIVGHLALFEMTSTEPNRRYGNVLEKTGFRSGRNALLRRARRGRRGPRGDSRSRPCRIAREGGTAHRIGHRVRRSVPAASRRAVVQPCHRSLGTWPLFTPLRAQARRTPLRSEQRTASPTCCRTGPPERRTSTS